MTSKTKKNSSDAAELLPISSVPRRFLGMWWSLFGGALALYSVTLQRHCGWQDSGWFQLRAVVEPYVDSDYTADLGLALGHPSYILVLRTFAKLFAFAPVYGINWVSALGMSIAVANVGYLVFRLTGKKSRWPAVMAAVLLTFTHVVWWLSTTAEVYTCVAALLTTELIFFLWLIERPSFIKACFFVVLVGIHWGFHNYALLAIPVYAAIVLRLIVAKRLSWFILTAAPLCFALGAWPYIRSILECAHTLGWWAAISSALYGKYGPEVLCVSPRWLGMVKMNAGLFSLNFLNPVWLLFAVGLWQCASKKPSLERGCLLAVLTLHGLFFVRYFVADQALFAVPTITLMAIVAGLGADALQRGVLGGRGKVQVALVVLSAVLPVCGYVGANRVLHSSRFAIANHRKLPFRDEVRYWVLPWKNNEDSAYLFKESVLAETEPDAIVVADSTAAIVLELETYLNPGKVERRLFFENRAHISVRDDAPLLSDFYRMHSQRPWYTVSPIRGYLADFFLDGAFSFQKKGVLYKINAVPCKKEN